MFDANDFPVPGQCYHDERGVRVTIIEVEDRRVVFMREGYPWPCMRPVHNFLAKFRKIPEEKSNRAASAM
ncbi:MULTISPECIES: DUF4222 domain-containing protein [Escherichia]|uniref:DUF4222 domain-containing protein n=1 Tax=Escherichia TaxID=561 RepID=UPI000CF75857|nr:MULTISPECIES: DUF4222 domain-containing protein [Escherichia]